MTKEGERFPINQQRVFLTIIPEDFHLLMEERRFRSELIHNENLLRHFYCKIWTTPACWVERRQQSDEDDETQTTDKFELNLFSRLRLVLINKQEFFLQIDTHYNWIIFLSAKRENLKKKCFFVLFRNAPHCHSTSPHFICCWQKKIFPIFSPLLNLQKEKREGHG
jgi:hypothetical protein